MINNRGNGQNDHSHQGHQPADGEHHHQHAQDRGHRSDDLGQALVEGLADGVHIIGYARKHLALVGAVKVTQRHAVDLFGDILAEFVGDLHRDTGHDPALDVGKHR